VAINKGNDPKEVLTEVADCIKGFVAPSKSNIVAKPKKAWENFLRSPADLDVIDDVLGKIEGM